MHAQEVVQLKINNYVSIKGVSRVHLRVIAPLYILILVHVCKELKTVSNSLMYVCFFFIFIENEVIYQSEIPLDKKSS